MKELGLTIREIDDLLEHLFRRLRGKTEGLSLLEPAVVLLQNLKGSNPTAYELNLRHFTPVIIDALISRAYISFGYDGLKALLSISPDIPMISGDYTPAGVESGLEEAHSRIDDIQSVLEGGSPGHANGDSKTSTKARKKDSFFHERVGESAFLPLVSVFNAGKSPITLGRIVQPHVELRITGEWSIRRKIDPIVTFDHMFAEPGSEFEKQIYTALEVAERFAVSQLGIRDIARMPREYRLSLPEAAITSSTLPGTMTGGSAGLSFTMLFISLLCRLDLSVNKRELIPGTAFSGIIGENGTIVQVEASFIENKIKAAFFSTCENLVLPSENYESGLEELERLRKEHKSRNLTLLGASNIDECLSDARIWRRGRTSFVKAMIQKAFHRRKHAAVAISLAFALIISSILYTRYFDSTITTVDHIDSIFVFKNRFGGIVNTYNFNFLPLRKYKKGLVKSFIGDFKGNGEKEIACVVTESFLSARKLRTYNQAHFFLFNKKGELQKEITISPSDTVGVVVSTQKIPRILKTSTIQKTDRGERILWIVIHYANAPPACLIRLSLVDYSYQLFFHDGYLQELWIRDVDGDEIDDVLLLGWNNKLKSSVMIVLDSRHVLGSSPRGAAYETPGYNTDIAKYYIKLPHFHLFKYYSRPAFGLSLRIHRATEKLSVIQKSKAEDVQYFFDKDLQCTGTNIVFSHKGISNVPDSVDLIAYDNELLDEHYMADNIRFWTGSGWVREPTVNNSYLKYIADLKKSTKVSGHP
ncbi:MAG: hypothetical protein KAV42_08925 [Candidatus Krumholzibacteria bacterium]|nr:hypothetical protein [Candidatus Krumholzibacteria bacterium]